MSNTAWIILTLLILGSGALYAKSKIEKTDTGFAFKSNKVHTWFESRILWGDDYLDHDNKTPVHNTEVIAFAEDAFGNIEWQYSTTTDDDGNFKVEVKPNTKFKIKASDGNQWATSLEQNGIPTGTTGTD